MTLSSLNLRLFYGLLCTAVLVLSGCNASDTHKNADITSSSNNKNNGNAKSTTTPSASATPVTNYHLRVAAISNLQMVLPILISDFNITHPNIKIEPTFAPNNILFNKITANRQNFDIYLAGNQAYPKQLLANDHHSTKPNPTTFTYTRGQLVLYSHKHPMDISPTTTLDQWLMDNKTFTLAIPNPENVTYGMAAEAWLVNQNLFNAIKPNIVHTHNIDETFALTDEGNADFGFVSLSQVLNKPTNNTLQNINARTNNYLILPKDSYPPILQDGVILNQPEVSQQFINYLTSSKAQNVLSDAGFLPICTSTTILPACK